MTSVRVVAVDDEPLALDRLRALLANCETADLVGCANSCNSGVTAIMRHNPDLVLLDIRMRDGSAFDLLSRLPGSVAPMVAFVTAYPNYACQAFDVSALDYLLKPVELAQLNRVLVKASRYRELMTAEERVAGLREVIANLRPKAPRENASKWPAELWVRQNGTRHVRVAVADVEWIDAQDDYACIHANGREHLLRISLDRLAASLDPELFVRIHRSVIVRAERVETVGLKRAGIREVTLRGGQKLPIGRVYANNLRWRNSPTQQ